MANNYYITAGLLIPKAVGQSPSSQENTYYITAGLPKQEETLVATTAQVDDGVNLNATISSILSTITNINEVISNDDNFSSIINKLTNISANINVDDNFDSIISISGNVESDISLDDNFINALQATKNLIEQNMQSGQFDVAATLQNIFNEAITANDSWAVNLIKSISLSDGSILSDEFAATIISAIGEAITSDTELGEQFAGLLIAYTSLIHGANFGDQFSILCSFLGSINEQSSLSDAFDIVGSYSSDIIEQVLLGDSFSYYEITGIPVNFTLYVTKLKLYNLFITQLLSNNLYVTQEKDMEVKI